MIDDYRGGYFKALIDVRDFFEIYEAAIIRTGRGNKKSCKFVRKVIDAVLNNLDLCMHVGPRGVMPVVSPTGDVEMRERR